MAVLDREEWCDPRTETTEPRMLRRVPVQSVGGGVREGLGVRYTTMSVSRPPGAPVESGDWRAT